MLGATKRVKLGGPGIFSWRLRLNTYLLGGKTRWVVQGYAVGDRCLRSLEVRSLPVGAWRWLRWRFGPVRWEELRLVSEQRRRRRVEAWSDRVGDGIVAAARASGEIRVAPEGASLSRLPFQHDYRQAPLMIDVTGVECEHPDCTEVARPQLRVITPFGYPVVCREHAVELMCAYTFPGAPEDRAAELEAVAWHRDAARFGPVDKDRRLEWLAAGKPRETLADG